MTSQIESSINLFSPLNMGKITLKNRVVMAPLTRARAGVERIPNQMMAQYYQQRASAGLIISEATVVSTQGIGWEQSPGIYNDEQTEAWKQVTEAVHEKSTPIFLQLWHCGRASHSDFQEGGKLPVAPSAIKIEGDSIHTPLGKKGYEVPRALETEEIPQIVADYRQAAERAKMAGFDGVEIHSANGYLLDQFLQSKTNKREDEYGGSIEKRFRLLKEVVEACISVLSPEQVGVRLSPNGAFNDMGSPDYRETFTYVGEQLNKYNLAYLHVMDGLEFGFHGLGEPITLKDMKNVFPGILMGNCGYTQAKAEAAIKSGDADLISFGRPFISNPDLVERFQHDWELNPPADMSVWYSHQSEGYIDFPRYEDSNM